MNISQVTAVCFSPTGSTKKILRGLAESQQKNGRELDFIDSGKTRISYSFLEHELVFVGAPVYGGRIPDQARRRFGKLHGHNTLAVAVVTYGNRDYDDALLELTELLRGQGFRVVAAAAIVTEHSIVRSIGAGRPDEKDHQEISAFSSDLSARLEHLESAHQVGNILVKGNTPYREYDGIVLKPKAGRACTRCGVCIRACPVQAISRTDAKVLDAERCISCMRCISICPVRARKLNPIMLKAASAGLKRQCRERRAAEFIL